MTMAAVAHFVSILLANIAKSMVLFLLCTNVIILPLHSVAGIKIPRDFKSKLEEFQNGEDNVEVFAQNFENENKNEFGQLKSLVARSSEESLTESDNGKIHIPKIFGAVWC